jgi:hypothetical protein
VNQPLHPFLAGLAAAGEWQPTTPPAPPRNGAHNPPPAASDPQAARYAAGALADEARRVAATPQGGRNHAANTAAFRMGQLIAHGWLSEQATADQIVASAVAAGLPHAEAERTVRSGLTAGKNTPRADVDLNQPVQAAYLLDTGPPATPAPGDPDAEPARPKQLVDGGTYIHDAATHVPALWGEDDDVLWAEGEPTILTGPTGVGKTTLGTMLVAGRLGLLTDVLGYPVAPGRRRTLVLAMDRPAQIQRAMARLLRHWPADLLNDRLSVWKGPPPMDLGRHPHLLYQLAQLADADTVVIDSLKDAAVKLSDEETGQGLSRAMNLCVTNGVEVLAYHHQTKRTASGQGKPNTLADVYGSAWITAGAGSVLLLWGNAGDLVVELSHLKQPASDVGPLSLGHDHVNGRSFLYEGMSDGGSLLSLLASGPQTAATVASWLYGRADDRATVAKARRRLDKLVDLGHAVRLDDGPTKGGWVDGRPGGGQGSRYVLASSQNIDARIDARFRDSRTKKDVSAGPIDARTNRTSMHASMHANTPENPGFPRSASMHAENRTNPPENQSFPRSASMHASMHVDARASMHATPPPYKGGGARVVRRSDPQDSPPDLSPGDVEVCGRCHQQADRLIPGTHGQRWCPRCAYPTENRRTDDEE